MDNRSRSWANIKGFDACLCRYCNGKPRQRKQAKKVMRRAVRHSRNRVIAEEKIADLRE